MKVLINYANDVYKKAQDWNSWTGKHIAGFDKVYAFSPNDIDKGNCRLGDRKGAATRKLRKLKFQ